MLAFDTFASGQNRQVINYPHRWVTHHSREHNSIIFRKVLWSQCPRYSNCAKHEIPPNAEKSEGNPNRIQPLSNAMHPRNIGEAYQQARVHDIDHTERCLSARFIIDNHVPWRTPYRQWSPMQTSPVCWTWRRACRSSWGNDRPEWPPARPSKMKEWWKLRLTHGWL